MKKEVIESLPLISLQEAKQHMRHFDDYLDDLILANLEAATEIAENFTGCSFANNLVRITTPVTSKIETDCFPIRNVTSITVDGKKEDPSCIEIDGSILRSAFEGKEITLEIETGYDKIPFSARAAILLIMARLVDNPLDSKESLPKASTNILRSFKRWNR